MVRYLLAGALVAVLAAGGLVYAGAIDVERLVPDFARTALFEESEQESDGQAAAGQGAGPVPVEVVPVERGTAEETFRTTGEVRAEELVVLTSEIQGMVADIAVEDGARVDKGDLILRFDAREEEAAVEAARAGLEQARKDFDRTFELAEKGFATKAEVDEVRSALETASAEFARARASLRDQIVRAPFAGEIGFVAVSPGALLSPGDEIASLATTGRLAIRISLPLDVAARIEPGDPVRIVPPDGEKRIPAELTVLAPLAEPATRSVEAEAQPAQSTGLRPGAFVAVEVITERREDAMFVPQTALVRDGEQAFVFVVDGTGKARRRKVAPGIRRGSLIEVEGIAADARVVAGGIQKVSHGAQVKVAGAGEPRETVRAAEPDG